jgi:dynein heavy chain
MKTAPQAGLLEAMQDANEYLEKIMNGVSEYLEKKRLYFSRFFFLANDEMLEILSETKDPLKVQPHLIKCFEGINRLDFNEDLEAMSMISVEKEDVTFVKKVSTAAARGSVEKWLLQVEEQMLVAIKTKTIDSWKSYEKTPRTEWIPQWPGMVVLCVSQIYWTADIQARLHERKLQLLEEYHEMLKVQLNDTVNLVRSKTISNVARITIKSLIVIDVHAKDVMEEMVKKKVNSEDDFNWLAQLRYYMIDERVMVNIINASIPYSYEYLGNTDRLVITPLTDRCYRTLIGAYQLHLNGAPEG